MRLMLRTAAIAASIVALSAPAFAQAPAPKPATKPAAEKPAKAAAKATPVTATGTVSKYDAATNTLTVTTAKGDETFVVGSSASVTAGGKKVMASDLPSHMGQKVTVKYTESGGQKMVESVRVTAPAAPKTASATKKTTPTKKS